MTGLLKCCEDVTAAHFPKQHALRLGNASDAVCHRGVVMEKVDRQVEMMELKKVKDRTRTVCVEEQAASGCATSQHHLWLRAQPSTSVVCECSDFAFLQTNRQDMDARKPNVAPLLVFQLSLTDQGFRIVSGHELSERTKAQQSLAVRLL